MPDMRYADFVKHNLSSVFWFQRHPLTFKMLILNITLEIYPTLSMSVKNSSNIIFNFVLLYIVKQFNVFLLCLFLGGTNRLYLN